MQIGAEAIAKSLGRARQTAEGWKCKCPAHDDRNPSLSVTNTADGLVLVYCHAGCEQQTVIDALRERGLWPDKNNQRNGSQPKPRKRSIAEWIPELPVPDEAPKPDLSEATSHWEYRDSQGRLLYYVLRIEKAERKKLFLPLVYGRLNGSWNWYKRHPKPPRPLYGLDRLAKNPTAQVLIVEGEKAADAAQRILPDFVVLTWPGGAHAAHRADWAPLSERKVYVWPDADGPGIKAASAVASALKCIGNQEVAIVDPPEQVDEGWDLADAELEDWNSKQVKERIDRAATPRASTGRKSEHASNSGDVDARHFRTLGYDHDRFYFLTSRGRQVIEASARALRDRGTLLMLAPLDFWKHYYPGLRGLDSDKAVDWLIQNAYEAGVYDPRRVRGRGAWWDSGRAVLHLGDRLLVGGAVYEVTEFESTFVYEAKPALGYLAVPPLSDNEAEAFLEICDMVSWERSISGLLLAGWCVVALAGGALPWRPHLCITSKAGAGKSWIMDNIIRRAIGPMAVFVQSKTTEAGLRQELGSDARPILFDEAESDDQRSHGRMQTVIELARACSSEGGAVILKGTSGGNVKRYQARSCFALSCINVPIHRYADETRFTILPLLPADQANEEIKRISTEHFAKLQLRIEEVLTPDFSSRLLARVVENLPTLRQNVGIFAEAVGAHLGSRRLGDQIGTLLAGAYLLGKTSAVTPEIAHSEIAKLDWSEYVPVADTGDEHALLSTLLEHATRVQTSLGTYFDVTIGDLVLKAAGKGNFAYSEADADTYLRRLGFRLDESGTFLLVSNTHSAIDRILKDTPWAKGWGRTLKRLPGAEAAKDPIRFGPAAKHRAVKVPMSLIVSEES